MSVELVVVVGVSTWYIKEFHPLIPWQIGDILGTIHHGISSAKRVVKSMRLQPFKRLPAKSSLPWEKVIGEERHSHWALDPWDG